MKENLYTCSCTVWKDHFSTSAQGSKAWLAIYIYSTVPLLSWEKEEAEEPIEGLWSLAPIRMEDSRVDLLVVWGARFFPVTQATMKNPPTENSSPNIHHTKPSSGILVVLSLFKNKVIINILLRSPLGVCYNGAEPREKGSGEATQSLGRSTRIPLLHGNKK